MGCPAEALRRYGSRSLAVVRQRAMERDGLYVVAMRAPVRCGALLVVEGRGRREWAIKIDAGPWGQSRGREWRWGIRLLPGWRWRGIVDLPCDLARLVLPGRGCVRRGIVRIEQVKDGEAQVVPRRGGADGGRVLVPDGERAGLVERGGEAAARAVAE